MKMNFAKIWLLALSSVAVATPQTYRLQASLFNGSGAPLSAATDLQIKVYSQITGGSSLWDSNVIVAQPSEAGTMTIDIDASTGSPTLLQRLSDASSTGGLWAEIILDSGIQNGVMTTPITVTPRFKISGASLVVVASSADGLVGLPVSTATPSGGQILKWNGTEWTPSGTAGTSGVGDMTGPASSTNNAAVLFSSVTGKVVANSAVLVDSAGNITGVVSGTTANVVNSSSLSPNYFIKSDASANLVSITTGVTAAELAQLAGVTANVHTQLQSRVATLTRGNIISATSALTIQGGTSSVIGSGVTLNVLTAGAGATGFLSSTDWSTFDGKQDTITGVSYQAARTSSDGLSWGVGAVDVGASQAVTGTLALANGGTGVTSSVQVYGAVSPATTKGDIVSYDGSNASVLAVGSNNDVLVSDSSATSGLSWSALSGVPTGGIVAWSSASIPSGFLLCDGTSYTRATYPALYSIIGNAYGTASGTTFNVPDMRGRFLRGRDAGVARDPDRASRTASATGGNTGDNLGSIQGSDFISHYHGYNSVVDAYNWSNYGSVRTTPNTTYNSNSSTNASGGSETRPINAYVNFIIKY